MWCARYIYVSFLLESHRNGGWVRHGIWDLPMWSGCWPSCHGPNLHHWKEKRHNCISYAISIQFPNLNNFSKKYLPPVPCIGTPRRSCKMTDLPCVTNVKFICDKCAENSILVINVFSNPYWRVFLPQTQVNLEDLTQQDDFKSHF